MCLDIPKRSVATLQNRDLFAGYSLDLIPKILTLQDRNRHSPTYGCFDRNFWQFKIIDFPSGMAQEFVWPLALAFDLEIDGSPFHGQEALRDWAEAGILYAARSAHADGSCDDYFPFEKAAGATAFSLLACIESYSLLRLENPEALAFLEKRADWLAYHHESGQLTNHQALIVLCLDRLGKLLDTTKWREARNQRLERVLAWQNSEGWFQEYEGCDPGYHTLTISLLAQVYETTPSPRLREALEKAVMFAAEFVHPDGSFGGEYASRNTYNFFPHGFETFGRHFPEALSVNDRFLGGLARNLFACHADDHILGHHAWNFLLAWRDFQAIRPPLAPRKTGRFHFPQAGLLIERTKDCDLYVALNKGGVFRLFRGGTCVASDTQISLVIGGRNAVAHLMGGCESSIGSDEIRVSGSMGWAKQKAMTPFRLIALRLIMLAGGRLFPDLMRKLLQKVLITGKSVAPFHFERSLKWINGQLIVADRVRGNNLASVEFAAIGCDQTSIYVVMSRTFQMAQLQPWIDLTASVRALPADGELEMIRRL